MRFAALDFETANVARNSACAVAIAVVEDGQIVRSWSTLIRPPQLFFQFTSIHGITARDVANAPTFAEIHDQILEHLEGAAFVAAHNASFDKSVMRATCDHFTLSHPVPPWTCTVKMARDAWDLRPTKLPDVCRHLGLSLKHHDALSDTLACANIAIAAQAELAVRGTPLHLVPLAGKAKRPVSTAAARERTTFASSPGRDPVAEMRAAISRLNRRA